MEVACAISTPAVRALPKSHGISAFVTQSTPMHPRKSTRKFRGHYTLLVRVPTTKPTHPITFPIAKASRNS